MSFPGLGGVPCSEEAEPQGPVCELQGESVGRTPSS